MAGKSLLMSMSVCLALMVMVIVLLNACSATEIGSEIVVAGDSAGNIFALDLASGSPVWNVTLGGDTRSMAVSEDCQRIVVGTGSKVALLSTNGSELWTKNLGVNPTDPVPPFQFDTKLVSVSADGKYILAAHSDMTVRLYDDAGTEKWNSTFDAASVALPSDGRSAVIGGPAGIRYYTVGLDDAWDRSDSAPVWVVNGVSVRKVAVSSNGKYVVAGDRGDGYVRLYDVAGRQIWTYRNLTERMSVDISRDGTSVVAGNDDSSDSHGSQLAYFWIGDDGNWTEEDGIPVWTFKASSGPGDDVRAVAFSFDGKYIASGGSADYAHTFLHRTDSGLPVFNSTLFQEDETIDVSFDGRYVVAADTQETAVRLYDTTGNGTALWAYADAYYVRSVAIVLPHGGSVVWVPSAEGALMAGALTIGLTSGVSTLASAVSNPESYPSSRLAGKINDVFPDTLKKWLHEFISSKRKLVIEQHVGFPFTLTRYEVFSYAVALSLLTFAFSYAKALTLNEILPLIPTVLATSIVVEFVKNYTTEVVARNQGVWTEHRLWYFGATMFLFSSLVFRVPFSSPSRLINHSPKFTRRSIGLVASTSVFIALVFAAVFYGLFITGFTLIGNIGLVMCLTMAFFDAIPIPPMNGKDIYDWSKVLWIALFVAAFALYVLCLLIL